MIASNCLNYKIEEVMKVDQWDKTFDVVIIGGGLAGLTASIYLARSGLSVLLAEKSNRLGGRAMTVKKKGAALNLGVHAFYQDGEGEVVLNELGVKLIGANPPPRVAGIWNRKVYDIPTGPVKLLTSRLLSLSGKAELVRFMIKLGRIKTGQLERLTLREWAEREINDPMIRHIVYSICRSNSFVPDPSLHGAREAVRQLQRTFAGKAFYLDGGWVSLINELEAQASRAGVVMATGLGVAEVVQHESAWIVHFSDNRTTTVPNVMMTGSPEQACKLVRGAEKTSLLRWKNETRPMAAACLDLVLRRFPNPKNRSYIAGFWLDAPIFYNSPSSVARLNDDGSFIIHLVKQLGEHAGNPQDNEQQLEAAMDLMHPGWRSEEIARQYLPRITVVHDFRSTDKSDPPPGPAVPEVEGLYVAGDWVSHGEVLADAAFASAKRAAHAIIKRNDDERRTGVSRNRNRTLV